MVGLRSRAEAKMLRRDDRYPSDILNILFCRFANRGPASRMNVHAFSRRMRHVARWCHPSHLVPSTFVCPVRTCRSGRLLVCKHARADVKRSGITMTPSKLNPESRNQRAACGRGGRVCIVTSWRVKVMINRLLRNALMARRLDGVYKGHQPQRRARLPVLSGSHHTILCNRQTKAQAVESFTLKKTTRPRNIRSAKKSLEKSYYCLDTLKSSRRLASHLSGESPPACFFLPIPVQIRV